MKRYVVANYRRLTCRSPAWGAWIETCVSASAEATFARRSPAWGAWIETVFLRRQNIIIVSLPCVGGVD